MLEMWNGGFLDYGIILLSALKCPLEKRHFLNVLQPLHTNQIMADNDGSANQITAFA